MRDLLMKELENYISNIKREINEELILLNERIIKYSKEQFIFLMRKRYNYLEISLSKNDLTMNIIQSPVSGKYFAPGYDVEESMSYLRDFAEYNIKVNNGKASIKIYLLFCRLNLQYAGADKESYGSGDMNDKSLF